MTPLEFKFLEYLKTLRDIQSINYKLNTLNYQDSFTGENLKYSPSFTIVYKNGSEEHVEVLPASQQMPLTQYLYAQNNLSGWRMITKEELIAIGEDDYKTPQWW